MSLRYRAHQARSKESVEKILDAASHLFERYGVASVTHGTIASNAGLARASVYRFFENKTELIDTLAERQTHHLSLALQKARPAMEPHNPFETLLERHRRFVQSEPAYQEIWHYVLVTPTIREARLAQKKSVLHAIWRPTLQLTFPELEPRQIEKALDTLSGALIAWGVSASKEEETGRFSLAALWLNSIPSLFHLSQKAKEEPEPSLPETCPEAPPNRPVF